jgi:23S rRNA-/tRNA-specific pseudouridylate synthase
MIAFDKPGGLPVAPDRRDGTRENLMGLVHEKMGRGTANVHRLDAGASGVVLCAKNKAALDFLSGQFQAGTAGKKYLALCVTPPPERAMKPAAPAVARTPAGALPEAFAVGLALGPDESGAGRMRVFRKRGGRPAVTEFRALEGFGRYTLFECRPLTARPHQIRVHLAAAGAPVLNDPFYGDPAERLLLSSLKRGYKGRADERPLIARLALHAGELTVRHPLTREPVTLRAPLPEDFAVALKYLRKFPPGARRGR